MVASFRRQPVVARPMVPLEAAGLFDPSPVLVDVSWARGVQCYLRYTQPLDAAAFPRMRVDRYTSDANGATAYQETVRDLAVLAPVAGLGSVGQLLRYADDLTNVTDGTAATFWFSTDGTQFISFAFAEQLGGGPVAAGSLELLVIPQYKGTR